jgi:hypothetical protein
MKLTTQQVNALTSKIYNEIRNEVKKYNDTLQTEEKFEKWRRGNDKIENILTKAVISCSDVVHNPQLKCISSYHFENIASYNLEDITAKMKRVFEKTLILKDYPTETMLKNDIILSTIECDNLDNLINNIKKKYI